jgi:hypothetical protein
VERNAAVALADVLVNVIVIVGVAAVLAIAVAAR